MIFYNPFFMPPFPKYPTINSTANAQSVNNSKNISSCNPKEQIPRLDEKKAKNQGKNQSFLPLDFLNKYLQETDNLIILAILYFLYQQKSNNNNLMLCLLLLLLD